MDYFNFAKLFKNIVYNFMRIFKYMSISLICICFIAICLLLMSTKSSAYAETTLDTFTYEGRNYECYLPTAVYDNIKTLPEYVSGNYYWCCFSMGSGAGEMAVQFIPKTYEVKSYLRTSLGYSGARFVGIQIEYSPNSMNGCVYYNLRENGGAVFYTQQNYIMYSGRFYASGTRLLMYFELPLYSDNTYTTLLTGQTQPVFTAPSFMPPDYQNSIQFLQTGDFIAFQIDPR